jgi:hypothetical protein
MPTGLVCPDCYGNLSLRVMGRRHLLFICRIGHSYDLLSLLESKEADLEHRVWSSVLGYEEMAALLSDLIAYRYVDPDTEERYRPRIEAARACAQHFRQVIERDASVRLTERDAGPASASQ